MKRYLIFPLAVFVAVSLVGIDPSSEAVNIGGVNARENGSFVASQLIIGYNNDTDMDEFSGKVKEKFNLNQIEKGYKGSFEIVEFANDKKMNELIEEVKKEKGVRYAEPNQICEASYVPNDPYFHTYQWNFYAHGRLFNGQASGNVEAPSDYGVRAETAWDLYKPTNTAQGAKFPGEGIKIAVLDTGIAYEDYTWTGGTKKNPITIVYKKAPDLVGTTFDTANAKNYVAWPNTTHANDDHYHGTHVCGTIAQATDTTTPLGCSGIAYKSTILPIKVLSKTGSGTTASVANGLYWSADKGAKVLNLSLGFLSGDTTLYNAVKYAYDKGCIIVCATGNDSGAIRYPAAYSECIGVGATDFNGALCSFSNYGSSIDIVAPGQHIVQQTLKAYQDLSGFSYWYMAGTSMATPHVSATAALIWTLNPTFTRDQVRSAMLSTARDLGTAGFDNYYGNGLLDTNAAVRWAP